MTPPVLAVERFRHRHANGRELDLAMPLVLRRGQAALVTGLSGSGKSTLLRALAGCAGESGASRWQADMLPHRPVLLLQETEAQLLCATVEEEVAFGLLGRGFEGAELSRRVDRALQALDIEALRRRPSDALSMGQKQRVVLAALLAMEPTLLLLDEPFSQLDAEGATTLRRLIARQKAEGRAILVTAHDAAVDDGWADFRIDLALPAPPRRLPTPVPAPVAAAETVALVAQRLVFRHDHHRPVLDGLDLELSSGTVTHLLGGNAAGKSTLLRCLAGLLTPQAGRIDLPDSPRPGTVRLAYLPQNVDLTLFEATVEREIGFTLGRALGCPDTRRHRTAEALAAFGLDDLAGQSPLCLSHGERHLVALASAIAAHPRLLLLDEPFAGLDDRLAGRVLDILAAAARSQGMAVLLASHAPLPVPWSERSLLLAEGRLHVRH